MVTIENVVLDHIKQSTTVSVDFQAYLNDESGIVTDGKADRIFFPTSISQVREVMMHCYKQQIPVTISGGGTGISGGRVPRRGWIIATDELRSIDHVDVVTWSDTETGVDYQYVLEVRDAEHAQITVPIAMTLKALQNLCRQLDWFYPVDPTERTSFLGGNIATNASGARTFKYGTTRNWIQKLTVLLPDGDIIHLDRNGDAHQLTHDTVVLSTSSGTVSVPRPTYKLPATEKNVAGPVLTDSSDPMDLFIGTGGMFGVVVQATFQLIRPPHSQVSLFIYTQDRPQAYEIIRQAQEQKSSNTFPIPMSVEYLGPRAVDIIKQHDDGIPREAGSLVMLEQDASSDEEMMDALEFWWNLCEELDVLDTSVAQNHAEIEHHKFLRHKVPETVNATVRSYGQAKLGTDYSVPNEYFEELFEYVFEIGNKFEEYQKIRAPLTDGFGYAVWAHAGNSHVHLNLLPRDSEEDKYAKGLITQVLNKVVALDGSIAAEHGLGKKRFDGKPALLIQYGHKALEEIKAMKQAVDPDGVLNPDNLLDP